MAQRWIDAWRDDVHVRRARAEGYRARSAWKLAELDRLHQLVRPGCVAVDLGAAPGAWSQYLRRHGAGRVVAIDLRPMAPIDGVEIIQGDFQTDEVLAQLVDAIGENGGEKGAARARGKGADLVLSDLAPNISGVRAADQARSMHLADLAFDAAQRILRPGGGFVVKLFQGEGFDQFVAQTRPRFRLVRTRKLQASRPRSPEVYLVALGHRA